MKCGSKAVTGSASSVDIDFATDTENESTPADFPAGYTVIVCAVPDWATSLRISAAPDNSGVSFAFGTAAASTGGILYWMAMGYKLA